MSQARCSDGVFSNDTQSQDTGHRVDHADLLLAGGDDQREYDCFGGQL